MKQTLATLVRGLFFLAAVALFSIDCYKDPESALWGFGIALFVSSVVRFVLNRFDTNRPKPEKVSLDITNIDFERFRKDSVRANRRLKEYVFSKQYLNSPYFIIPSLMFCCTLLHFGLLMGMPILFRKALLAAYPPKLPSLEAEIDSVSDTDNNS